MVRIGVNGAGGKMGKRIIELARQDADVKVVFGIEAPDHPSIGKVIDGVKIAADGHQIRNCDCLVDFSSVFATLTYLPYLVEHKKCAVIGTTGFDKGEQAKVYDAASLIPVIFSPNMSVGVNVLFRFVSEAAAALKGYNVYIEEAHHSHKLDAPSGTAKRIAQLVNKEGFAVEVDKIKSVREGEIVGDHKIVFDSPVDKIELFHSAKTRDIFVKGALLAAKWIVGKPKGLYSMEDVLFR